MKTSLVFLLFLSTQLFSGLVLSSPDLVPTELEFEEIMGAQRYHLELKSLLSGKIHNIQQKSYIFQFKIKPGKYDVRTRVSDHRGVFSPWSETQSFEVQPDPPSSLQGLKNEFQVAKNQLSHNLKLSWNKGTGATKYLLKIKNELGETIEKTVNKTSFAIELAPGVYTFEVFSITQDDVYSITSLKSNLATAILPADLDPPKTQDLINLKTGRLKLKAEAPIHFELEEVKFLGSYAEMLYQGVVEDGLLVLDSPLPPGSYKMTMWAAKKGFRNSNKLVKEFVIKPEEKFLKKEL